MTYLENRGITPVKRLTGGKLSYLCPLPGHKESKPSFIVFTNAEYENYYCFGCGSGTTIIQLVAALDSISNKRAIEILSDGMEITEDLELELSDKRNYRQRSKDEIERWINLNLKTLSTLPFLAEVCRAHLESVEMDDTECGIIDKFWEQIDKWISEYEFDELRDLGNVVPPMLMKRRENFEQEKRRKHESERSN